MGLLWKSTFTKFEEVPFDPPKWELVDPFACLLELWERSLLARSFSGCVLDIRLEDLRDTSSELLSGGEWYELYENERYLFSGRLSGCKTIILRCSKLKEYLEALCQFANWMQEICFSQYSDSNWQNLATTGVTTAALVSTAYVAPIVFSHLYHLTYCYCSSENLSFHTFSLTILNSNHGSYRCLIDNYYQNLCENFQFQRKGIYYHFLRVCLEILLVLYQEESNLLILSIRGQLWEL